METQIKELNKMHSEITNIKQRLEKQMIELNVEMWKKITGYNYSVSSLGRVRNDKRGNFLKPRNNKNGYYRVALLGNGKPKDILIHRLVALYFIGNPDNKPCVDHIDNNKINNNINNLRWVTIRENCQNSSINTHNTSGCKGVHY
jgi:hypothetical protein